MRHGQRAGANRRNGTIYTVWVDMKRRCYNPRRPAYKWYGAKGIEVCAQWRESFEQFLADMGDRPIGMSIDRIDVHGNYEPSNCRWATQKDQQRNRSSNKLCANDAVAIRTARASGESQLALAQRFEICTRLVRAIEKGEKWV